jgi:hypothetical protein
MINITSTTQDAIKKLQVIPGKLNRAANKTLRSASDEVTRIMKRPGLPITYPVDWDSLKQKIAVIIKLKKRGELPYRRKNAYVDAWQNHPIESGYQSENIGHQALFLAGAVSGTYPGAVHVTSTGQSHIARGRWRLVKPVVDAVLARLPEALLKNLHIEVNQ